MKKPKFIVLFHDAGTWQVRAFQDEPEAWSFYLKAKDNWSETMICEVKDAEVPIN